MTTRARDGVAHRLVVCLLLLLPSLPSRAADIAQPLVTALQSAGPADEIPIIIRLADRVDSRAFTDRNRRVRRRQLLTALRRKADLTQGPVRALLGQQGATHVAPLWILNGLATRARPDVIRELGRLRAIESMTLDATLSAPEVTPTAAAPPEWNLTAIGAPVLWDLGYTGTGIVAASMDTGVDVDHPDLGPTWRGGTNSWFDPYGQHASPADVHGHGTQTMGLFVGGAAGGTAIGVAPGARWISVKIFDDDGVASASAIHLGFQWLLDPDGSPSTDDAPDVVNGSWGFSNQVDECETEFEPDVALLRAAGIAVVFSGGNAGPNPATSLSPANYAGNLAVGAVDQTGVVPSFSSRGPSACDGDIYPDVAAPGVSVKTADLTFGGVFPDSYVHTSGTSFATPHVAGGIALLMEAHPDRSASEVEVAIRASALDGGPSGPDQAYGYGQLDLASAHDWLATTTSTTTSSTTSSTTTTSTSTTTTSSTTTTVPPPTQMLDIPVRVGNDDAEESASGGVDRSSSDLELVRDSNNQTVGVRFAGVTIPPGATIDHAWVQFKVDETGSEATTLTITGQNVGNAPAFTTSSGSISARERTVAVSWPNVPAWPTVGARGAAQQTPELKTILQQVVNRGDWASGNAVVIILQGTGRRVAEAYEGDRAGAPTLHVEFHAGGGGPTTTTTLAPASTTTTTTSLPMTTTTTTTLPATTHALDVPVRSGNDDAEESTSGSVDRGSSDLELVRDSNNQTVGLRFTGVAIPPGATIERAWVQFKVDETGSEGTTLTITGHDVGNAPVFATSAHGISARPRTVAVSWPQLPAWPTVGTHGPAQQTPELKAILQQLVLRGDWASGNAVVIIFQGTGRRVAESYDGDQAGAPTLHVEFSPG